MRAVFEVIKRSKFRAAVIFGLLAILATQTVPMVQTQDTSSRTHFRTVSASGTADYTVGATGANVQAQTALNALPVTGGQIDFLSGTFQATPAAATVTRAIPGVTINGVGVATYFANNAAISFWTAGGNNWTLSNLKVDVNTATLLAAMGATTGWRWENVTTSDGYFSLRTQSGVIQTQLVNAPTGRGATYVIAAVDATATEKAQADAVLTGTNDQILINANKPSSGVLKILGRTVNLTSLSIANYGIQGSGSKYLTINASVGVTIGANATLSGVTVNTPSSFSGTALLVGGTNVGIYRVDNILDDVTVNCPTNTGTGLKLEAVSTGSNNAYIVFSSFGDIQVNGFAQPIVCHTANDTFHHSYINANVFESLFVIGGTTNMVYLYSDSALAAEIAGNTFQSIQLEPAVGVTVNGLVTSSIAPSVHFNSFNNFYSWDWDGASGYAVYFDSNAVGNTLTGHTSIVVKDDGYDNKFINKYNYALGTDIDQLYQNNLPSGTVDTFVASTDLTAYQLCYVNSSGDLGKAKADSSSTMPALYIVATNVAYTERGNFLSDGYISNYSWSWTPGQLLYASSTTAGAITATAPTTPTHIVQVIGIAVSPTVVKFSPSLNMVVVP